MPDQLAKPVWWRTILGFLLIFIEVHSRIHPAPNLLKAIIPANKAG
jgi:hypothetical protein